MKPFIIAVVCLVLVISLWTLDYHALDRWLFVENKVLAYLLELAFFYVGIPLGLVILFTFVIAWAMKSFDPIHRQGCPRPTSAPSAKPDDPEV